MMMHPDRYESRGERQSVQKINNCLFFSTFIYMNHQITNIISLIPQQAPEYGVSKITGWLRAM